MFPPPAVLVRRQSLPGPSDHRVAPHRHRTRRRRSPFLPCANCPSHRRHYRPRPPASSAKRLIRIFQAPYGSATRRSRRRVDGLPNLEQAVESFCGSQSREAFGVRGACSRFRTRSDSRKREQAPRTPNASRNSIAWPRFVGQHARASAHSFRKERGMVHARTQF